MAVARRALCAFALAGAAAGDGKVTVHIVPHTHDDVGWLKTVDQYYAGLNNTIQHASVKMILSTVIRSLAENPERKFTYVEQAFFFRWWRQQSAAMQDTVRRLVQRGQLSFTNGGWCMHDEATPFYLDMIDQTTLGHRFLNDTFGFAPKTGWQLDPFGHSATQAALLSAEVGIVGLFFGRIDYQDLADRIDHRAAEFVWRASPSLGASAEVFSGLTGSYQGNYGPPPGFLFDVVSSDAPVQDDPRLSDYNVKSRVDGFVAAAMDQANHTRGSNVMFTMGSDFLYENALEDFEPMDALMRYVNADGRVRVVYSTPEQYLAAKAGETEVSWPLKTDDFFPYADGAHMFWTGFFTSRPAFKRYVRETSAIYQVARQLRFFAGRSPGKRTAFALTSDPSLDTLADAMGVAQHHDAVSGTAKQHVTFDYAARLAAGRAAALPGTVAAVARLAGLPEGAPIAVCDLRNVSVCAATRSGAGVVVLWNGLAQDRSEVVELPVNVHALSVQTLDGTAVPSQVVPSLPSVTNYGAPAGGALGTALFSARVPAMGFAAFRFSTPSSLAERAADARHAETVTLENEFLALVFVDGNLERITDKTSGVSAQAKQSWLMYNSSRGEGQNSGAYIFRPYNASEAVPVFSAAPTLSVVRGPVADEVHQTFGQWISQRVRLAKGARHAEITYTVGPIPVGADGKEVVTRISADIQTAGECYTDSNGREMLLRKRDFRSTWRLNQTERVAGNYFPVVTSMFIKDAARQLTLLTDATQAGSGCVHDGELEAMVHRRVLVDDGRGVAEPLNETEFVTPYVGPDAGTYGRHYGRGLVTRGKHFLLFGAPDNAARQWRPLADAVYMPLQPFFAGAGAQPGRGGSLARALPPNVQIVTLEVWDDRRTLLRLAHQFGLGEDVELSKPASVNLADLFAGRTVVSADERGLAVSIAREEVLKRRVSWRTDGDAGRDASEKHPDGGASDLQVTLGPLQIRTFLVEFATESGPAAPVVV